LTVGVQGTGARQPKVLETFQITWQENNYIGI
jgi:hypothetical protein